MRRKDFCRYLFYLSGGMIGTSFPNLSLALTNDTDEKWLNFSTDIRNHDRLLTTNFQTVALKNHYRWGIVYWMPYDNDLETFGEEIITMLKESNQNSDILIIVQSDYLSDKKMRRYLLFDGRREAIKVEEEDSSNPSALANYLDWVNQSFQAEHWGVIIVGHGGKMNEISPDDHGQYMINRTWMEVEQLSDVISHFNQQTDGKVEFLFFQNCNKATLEVIYQVRNCAKYTLASQGLLGVPNYYYRGFLNALKQPLIEGREAAIALMNSERSDMYHTLTLVDNQAVKKLPQNLLPFVSIILNRSFSPVNIDKLLTYSYGNEKYCDLLLSLNYLAKMSHQGKEELREFTHFLQSSMITYYKTGGTLYKQQGLSTQLKQINHPLFSGLGLYIPESKSAISRYRSFDIYGVIDLIGLYSKMFS